MNVNEPLKKCRDGVLTVKTVQFITWTGLAWRKPVYWPCGSRHREGMTLIRARIRNTGSPLAMLVFR